jgi:hypothetical protein
VPVVWHPFAGVGGPCGYYTVKYLFLYFSLKERCA